MISVLKTIKILFAFVVFALLFWSCKSSSELANRYLLYDKGQFLGHVKIEYCWQGNSKAELHLKCDSFPSVIRIHDSVSVEIAVSQDSIEQRPIQKLRFVFDSTFQGVVTLQDIDSTKSLNAFIVLQGQYVAQSVTLFIHSQRTHECIPVSPLNNYFTLKDSLRPRSRIQVFDSMAALPLRTISTDKPIFGKNEIANQLYLQSGYLYRDQNDTLHTPQTFSPFIAEPAYPNIQTIYSMYRPLYYIDADLPRYINDSIARLYVELFWYKSVQKDFVKARELMRIYYNRVQLANEFFTSYKEGWMTDRGMALILCGLADEIHADYDGETWVYYAEGDAEDLVLHFMREKDSPVMNDLRLERARVHESIWIKSIQNWKHGDIFSTIN